MRIPWLWFVVLALSFNCAAPAIDFDKIEPSDSTCNVQREAARKGLEKGKFIFPETRNYRNGLYLEEAFYILYNVKPTVSVVTCMPRVLPTCYDTVIDSLIVSKFGKNAFENAQNYADSLFAVDPTRYSSECFYAPMYIPNEDSMRAQLRRTVHYPASAKRDSLSGTVYLRLIIDSTGFIDSAYVVKGVRHDLDSAAIDAALKLGKFRTYRRWGIMQEAITAIPIKFVLE